MHRIKEPVIPIDWQRLLLNLRKHKPLSYFANEVGLTDTQIGRLAREEMDEPKLTPGLKLLDYHLELMGLHEHRKIYKN